MADTDVASEPVFRANKRRKVFRKRRGSDEEEAGAILSAEAGVGEDGLESQAADEVDGEEGTVLRTQKRGGVRKIGIGFSSTDSRKTTQQQDSEAMALVPVTQDIAEEMQNVRFVKPTGREVVSEDKHMMAYIDSKLAEMRSTAASSADANTTDSPTAAPATSITGNIAVTEPARPDERTLQLAQARSDRVYRRPTKRPRKKKYERDEADIARDAYIDQFMQEAQVPIYDRSSVKGAATDMNGDNDAAAAEAFKAQLLVDMEMNRRRPPKSASAQAANVTSGPKLGGSRQQREKMRALQAEEAKK